MKPKPEKYKTWNIQVENSAKKKLITHLMNIGRYL